jgi:purine-binding chemotaxis protein CheW
MEEKILNGEEEGGFREPVNSMESMVTHVQLACFNLGDKLMAADIMRIREIIVPQPISPLPSASDFLDGVINLRGAVIPVMNLRKLFGMPVLNSPSGGKMLIVSLTKQSSLALIVDDVLEVISMPVAGLMPPAHISPDDGMELILGVCLSNNQICMILDIDALLNIHGHIHDMESAQCFSGDKSAKC